jgi:hypothetical protein
MVIPSSRSDAPSARRADCVRPALGTTILGNQNSRTPAGYDALVIANAMGIDPVGATDSTAALPGGAGPPDAN